MNETRQQKLEYLTNNGYLRNLQGEGYLSTKALSSSQNCQRIRSPPSSPMIWKTKPQER